MPTQPKLDQTDVTETNPSAVTGRRRVELGAAGERLATEHLVRRGFSIIDRNFRTRWGELDIVALHERTIVFCEVKTRVVSTPLGAADVRSRDPLESVHPRKRAQVRRMAARWLVERRDRPLADELRFDAIGVAVDAAGRLLALDHLEGAF
jgi:putative endonuclease